MIAFHRATRILADQVIDHMRSLSGDGVLTVMAMLNERDRRAVFAELADRGLPAERVIAAMLVGTSAHNLFVAVREVRFSGLLETANVSWMDVRFERFKQMMLHMHQPSLLIAAADDALLLMHASGCRSLLGTALREIAADTVLFLSEAREAMVWLRSMPETVEATAHGLSQTLAALPSLEAQLAARIHEPLFATS